jgi:hypothetical protein
MTSPSQFLLYTAPNGDVKVDVFFKGETVWLVQKAMAELFGVERSVITKHLRNIFKERELVGESVCAVFAQTAADGKTYQTRYYNLDAIIAVGYRVNSYQATQFQEWHALGTPRDTLLPKLLSGEISPSGPESTKHSKYSGETSA